MATISQSTDTPLMALKDTGTPKDGVLVPQRPGPINMIEGVTPSFF
jgi:hypothetical protein